MVVNSVKWLALFLILVATVAAGIYPFIRKWRTSSQHDFAMGESLAAGIFLGAALIHMMGEASEAYRSTGHAYPMPFLLVGITFLFFLLLEHIGREIYQHADSRNPFAILAVTMLSIHSFLEGVALGLSESLMLTVVLLMAILVHKWAASFALSVQINKANFSLRSSIAQFATFALMTPLGILAGVFASQAMVHEPMLVPVFGSLAAGTFLYLGTLHGLERAALIKQCCNLKSFAFVILGFATMALVAIWV